MTFGDLKLNLILKCKVCGTREYVLAKVEEIDFFSPCCFCGSLEYRIIGQERVGLGEGPE